PPGSRAGNVFAELTSALALLPGAHAQRTDAADHGGELEDAKAGDLAGGLFLDGVEAVARDTSHDAFERFANVLPPIDRTAALRGDGERDRACLRGLHELLDGAQIQLLASERHALFGEG